MGQLYASCKNTELSVQESNHVIQLWSDYRYSEHKVPITFEWMQTLAKWSKKRLNCFTYQKAPHLKEFSYEDSRTYSIVEIMQCFICSQAGRTSIEISTKLKERQPTMKGQQFLTQLHHLVGHYLHGARYTIKHCHYILCRVLVSSGCMDSDAYVNFIVL